MQLMGPVLGKKVCPPGWSAYRLYCGWYHWYQTVCNLMLAKSPAKAAAMVLSPQRDTIWTINIHIIRCRSLLLPSFRKDRVTPGQNGRGLQPPREQHSYQGLGLNNREC